MLLDPHVCRTGISAILEALIELAEKKEIHRTPLGQGRINRWRGCYHPPVQQHAQHLAGVRPQCGWGAVPQVFRKQGKLEDHPRGRRDGMRCLPFAGEPSAPRCGRQILVARDH